MRRPQEDLQWTSAAILWHFDAATNSRTEFDTMENALCVFVFFVLERTAHINLIISQLQTLSLKKINRLAMYQVALRLLL